ncbi:Pre-mRNA-splicing factor SYF2 [Cytospora paraplurivora]|uniref:Pre-mRNA-splicing factor SYF2 n=1 Tax=Cytospora paraplurivora TaxID=2898453 RepID=A0AAN9YAS1_9PEZI
MPPAKKRKTAASAKAAKGDHVVTATTEPASPPPPPAAEAQTAAPEPSEDASTSTPAGETQAQEETPASESTAPAPTPAPSISVQERMARFRALQSRAKTSSASNLSAAQTEAHRLANDPAQLATIQRKSAIASNKLLKADIEDEGGDFERKRAWDWTVDESEKWDRRVAKKDRHRDDIAFADYRREANKVYKRQLKNLGDPDLERYEREKLKAIEAAAARGTLEIVETEDGEMIAVDKDGTFYGGGGGDVISSFADNKPDKRAVDRLVGEMKKAEEVAAKKRRERLAKNGDDGDVTYINDKNKQFNQKLARFYNKYTAEIRESFERGTMI